MTAQPPATGQPTTTVDRRDADKPAFMDRYLQWFIRWMPESFVICLALTLAVAILAFVATKSPVWSTDPHSTSLVSSWTDGFWKLLSFTMQMTVLLATGSAVASSPPASKLLARIARIPKTRTQAIILGSVAAGLLGFVHWGLGMMGAIVLGREILAEARRRGIPLHPPVMVAVLFMAFLPSSGGISGAAVLYSATPGYLKKLVPENYQGQTPDTVPLTDSILRWDYIVFLAICMVVTVSFALIMHPRDKAKVGYLPEEVYAEIEAGTQPIEIPRTTPAEKMNGSRWIMYLIGGVGLAFSLYTLYSQGITGITLDSFNFLFLTLGIVLNAPWGPEHYGKLIREGIQGTWGFILQFPFYAGIFGLISGTGLGVVLANFFTRISSPTTWPVISFLYAGVLNIAVPSGGSKFVIEAPYIVPTTLDHGADLGLILQAYQLGDGVTNLLIPFFALPYLANFKLRFSEVVGYTVPPVIIITVLSCIYLFIRAAMG